MTASEESNGSRERIIAAATQLFSQRGYQATSTRAIGDAAGLNIGTVAYHVGGKPDLYREVMRRAHAAQGAAVMAALGDVMEAEPTAESTVAALHHFVDAYLDFCLSHPEVPALWMRRWLDDGEGLDEGADPAGREDLAGEDASRGERGSDVDEIVKDFAGPLVARVAEGVGGALDRAGIGARVDLEMLAYSIVWSTHSFSRAGFVDSSGARRVASSPAMTDRFRAHLHQLVDGVVLRSAD